jgi:hypothetical protein
MLTAITLQYDADALKAMASATAYPPLPTEPHEQRIPLVLVVADGKSQPKPAPVKPAYEPLPPEPDTRDLKPGKSK